MAAEPETLHVGLVDFFSILLPGAVLAFYLRDAAVRGDFGLTPIRYGSAAEGWAIFAVLSYVLGHFIFVAGSLLDRPYDRIRGRLEPLERNPTLKAAIAIRAFYLDRSRLADASINTFQWAKCRLALAHPTSLQHVQRFEADSKFFRSFTIVLLALALAFAVTGRSPLAITSAALAIASIWRYGDQRFKSTRQAYWYVVTLESLRKEPTS